MTVYKLDALSRLPRGEVEEIAGIVDEHLQKLIVSISYARVTFD